MRVLITGGAGYLGSVITEQLLKLDYEVTILDNLMYNQTSCHIFSHYKTFQFIHGDVRNVEVLTNLVKSHDIIIPLAAIVGFPACDRDKDLATAVNYTQIKNICDALEPSQKILYPNTNSGYGIGENGECTEESPLNPISHYGKTKVQAENEVLSNGGISLRLATVFGSSPRMRMDLLVNEFVFKCLSDKYITLFEHKFVRNFIHIRDVAKAFIHMIENYDTHSGEMFNVGLSDENITKLDLVLKIKKHITDLGISYADSFEDPDKRDYIVSNQKIENTGWKPDYSLNDGIEELIKTYDVLVHNLSNPYRNDLPLSYGNR